MTYRFRVIVLLMAMLWQIVSMLTAQAVAQRVVELEHVTFHWHNTDYHPDNQTIHVEDSDGTSKHLPVGDESIGAELLDTGLVPVATVGPLLLSGTPVRTLGPTPYLEAHLRPPDCMPEVAQLSVQSDGHSLLMSHRLTAPALCREALLAPGSRAS